MIFYKRNLDENKCFSRFTSSMSCNPLAALALYKEEDQNESVSSDGELMSEGAAVRLGFRRLFSISAFSPSTPTAGPPPADQSLHLR